MAYPQRSFLFYFFLGVLLFLIQVYALDEMAPIHGLINVYIYFLPLLLFLPIRVSNYQLSILALFLGLCMDIMYDSFGLFMLASFWVGAMRNRILKIFFSSRKINLIGNEYIGLGNISIFGLASFFLIVAALHSFVLMVLETFAISFTYHFILKWLLDTIYTTVTLLVVYVVYYNIVQKPSHK